MELQIKKLKELREVGLIALEFDYVPSWSFETQRLIKEEILNTKSTEDEIGQLLNDYEGCDYDNITNKINSLIDKL
jgi:hypothetical protein